VNRYRSKPSEAGRKGEGSAVFSKIFLLFLIPAVDFMPKTLYLANKQETVRKKGVFLQ